jgi:hypothetical protein
MGNIMKAKSYLLWLIISVPAPLFAGSDGIMFHCEIDKEWIDLFFDINRVAHYVHSKDYVIDLALDNRRDTNLFKMSSVPLVGGGQAHIKFTNGAYDYYLYDITAHSGDEYIFKSGVAVLKDGVVLSNRECINGATILSDAYERLPNFDQDPISFVQDEVHFYK